MSLSEPSNFKVSDEKSVNVRALNEPLCIQNLPTEHQERSILTTEQFNAAKTDLMNKSFTNLVYPRTLKLHIDDPLNGQNIGLISFIPSKNATPDSEGCYGVLKLRGTFQGEREADSRAEDIIRNRDSYAVIDYCYVGKNFPLMHDNSVYRSVTKEIDIRRKVDEIQREDLKTKRENEKQEMASVQERHRELMRDTAENREMDTDDLELYTQLRTKKAHLVYNKGEMLRKIKESEDLISKVNIEIWEMDKTHPEYKSEFLQRYKDALAASGISEHTNPLLQHMRDDFPEST